MSALYFIFLDFNPSGAVSLYEVLYLSPGVYYPSMSLRVWYATERDSTFVVASLCVNEKRGSHRLEVHLSCLLYF